MKLKRIIFTVLISVLSILAWSEIWIWIVTPKDYDYDGATNIGYGFIVFIFLVPLSVIVTAVILWILSKRIFPSKEKMEKQEADNA